MNDKELQKKNQTIQVLILGLVLAGLIILALIWPHSAGCTPDQPNNSPAGFIDNISC